MRDDLGPESDLNFLYTFANNARWGWDFVTLGEERSALLGRPVDLVPRRGTRP